MSRSLQTTLLLASTMLLVSTIGSVVCDFHLAAFSMIADNLSHQSLSSESAYNFAQLTIACFLVPYAIGGFFAGPLADQFKKNRLILIGLILALASSIVCALANHFYVLLFFRALQGLGTALAAITIRSMLTSLYKGQELKRMSDIFSIIAPVLFTLSPALGTYSFNATQSWRALFLLLAGYITVVTILCIRSQKAFPSHQPSCQTPFFQRFIRDSQTILKHQDYLGNLAVFCLTTFMVMSVVVQMEVIFIQHLQCLPNEFALIQLVLGSTWLLGAGLNWWLNQRLSCSHVVSIGCTISIISFLALSLSINILPPLFLAVFIPLALFNFSMPLIFANTFLKCIKPFKKEAGTANAIMNLCQYAASGLGALLTALLTHANTSPQWPICLFGLPIMSIALVINIAVNQKNHSTLTPQLKINQQ